MITEIISAISTGAGIYLLAKQKGESDAKDDFDSSVEELAEEKASEYIAEQKAEEAAKDPRYRDMYLLDDKESEYDPFYDYTSDSTFYSEDVLTQCQGVANNMSKAFRCRFLDAICAESKEYPIDGINNDMYHIYGNSELGYVGDYQYRAGHKGYCRYYALVMEVFNPFQVQAPLRKIVLKDIYVGGDECNVVWSGGYCHDYDNGGIVNASNLYYMDGSTCKCYPLEYEFRTKDLTIPARSSVYLKIILPLAIRKEINLNKTIISDKTQFCRGNLETIAKRYFYYNFPSDYNSVTNNKPDTYFRNDITYELMKKYDGWDNYDNIRNTNYTKYGLFPVYYDFKQNKMNAIIENTWVAPKSLRNEGLKCTAILCSNDGFYVPEHNTINSQKVQNGVSVHDIGLLHNVTSQSNQYVYELAQFGDYEGVTPVIAENGYGLDDQLDTASEYVTGDTINDGLYDYTHDNLG